MTTMKITTALSEHELEHRARPNFASEVDRQIAESGIYRGVPRGEYSAADAPPAMLTVSMVVQDLRRVLDDIDVAVGALWATLTPVLDPAARLETVEAVPARSAACPLADELVDVVRRAKHTERRSFALTHAIRLGGE